MRLLNTETGQFCFFNSHRDVQYAILSHVWSADGEQSFQDLRAIQDSLVPTTGLGPTFLWLLGLIWIHLLCCLAEITDSLRILFLSTLRCEGARACPVTWLKIWSEHFRRVAMDARRRTHSILYHRGSRVSAKVQDACAVARADGFRYIWIDSCCIDKTSSAELSEAINSMYMWYRNAVVCYAWLADVPCLSDENDPHAPDSLFRNSKWFTRGWTLQELIAPPTVVFLSALWNPIGTRASLGDTIHEITNINVRILKGDPEKPIASVSVAERMSWAARRKTTRIEDEAYALMGLFDVSFAIVYGEGRRAFVRLQEAILRQSPDSSLLAWGRPHLQTMRPTPERDDPERGTTPPALRFWNWQHVHEWSPDEPNPYTFFAFSPLDFEDCVSIRSVSHNEYIRRLNMDIPFPEYSVSPHGVRTTLPLLPVSLCFPNDFISALPIATVYFLVILPCERLTDGSKSVGELMALVCEEINRPYYGNDPPPPRSCMQLAGGSYLAMAGRQIQSPCRVVTLTADNLAQWRPHVRMKTIHIPSLFPYYHSRFHSAESFSIRGPTVVLRLYSWCENAIRGHGYTLGPSSRALANAALAADAVHVLTMSKGDDAHLRIQLGPCHLQMLHVPVVVTALHDEIDSSPGARYQGKAAAHRFWECVFSTRSGVRQTLRFTLQIVRGAEQGDREWFLSYELMPI